MQECSSSLLSDAEPLFLPRNLYLKPIAKLSVSIQLPHFKKLIGKSVSTLEIIEKIKELIKPYEFTHIKVVTSTISLVEFEVEVGTRAKLKDVLRKLDGKILKLKNFKDVCKVRSSEWRQEFPHQQEWNDFFAKSKEMDERKPGERPDTIHISGLPISWFARSTSEELPSERLFFELFMQFGKVRKVDIPICDPYRSKMKKYLTGMICYPVGDKEFFEGYVQFYDYSGFVKTMEAFKGMKLVHKQGKTAHMVEIKVDFDKSKHLSLGYVKRREILRERLIEIEAENKKNQQKEESTSNIKPQEENRSSHADLKNDKETRKKLREERRKAKLLNQLKDKSSDEMNEKIAREEYKILKAQRKLESIRLIEALFRRIKNVDLKNKNIHDVIKEKRQLMRTAVVWSEASSSSSSEQDDHESDAAVPGTPYNQYGWCHPFLGGAYLPSTQKVFNNYPLLQQEEYVKYFSKFLYDKDNRYSNYRPPAHRFSRPTFRRNYSSYKPYRRRRIRSREMSRSRSRTRSSTSSSSRSRSSSRRRRSSTRSSHRSRRS